MRTGLAYTSARILLFIVALVLLYLAGARGILLLALAIAVSALASYVLLSKQRDVMAGALQRKMSRVTNKATEFRSRLEEGASSEDEDAPAAGSEPAPGPAGSEPGPAEPEPVAGSEPAPKDQQVR
jgi:uncharacterized protein (DUF58 family)